MIKTRLNAGLVTMLSTALLVSGPVLQVSAATDDAQPTAQQASSTSDKDTAGDTTATAPDDETVDEVVKGETQNVEAQPTSTEEARTQTLEIHQVISKQSSTASTMANTSVQGVNGSTWRVYEITDQLQAAMKQVGSNLDAVSVHSAVYEKLKSENYDTSSLKLVDSGTTANVDGTDGVFQTTVTVPAHQYRAFLFVNTAVPEYTTKADNAVVIAPLADEEGKIPDKMVIQPKSNTLPKPTPKKLTQTDHQYNGILGVIGAAIVALAGSLFFFRKKKTN
ncbi:LPXTG cell wall anchor domain-containing protein [Lacticaseibacillus sharpeae]|uniref:LPXTG cell wall anchor domain-containing protein n=1 Tax=Lacticaseibacillus sharpeae TaxID=1626 RepID=UPI0006D19F05|nr:LPXTG cell wall anchor domain-containing protein [Lacticaseibacillus sharpeae]